MLKTLAVVIEYGYSLYFCITATKPHLKGNKKTLNVTMYSICLYIVYSAFTVNHQNSPLTIFISIHNKPSPSQHAT